jgi:hypothetical protein
VRKLVWQLTPTALQTEIHSQIGFLLVGSFLRFGSELQLPYYFPTLLFSRLLFFYKEEREREDKIVLRINKSPRDTVFFLSSS